MDVIHQQRVLNDQHTRAAVFQRTLDPALSMAGLGIQRVPVCHHDIGILERGCAPMLGSHANRCVVGVADIPRVDVRRLKLLVVDHLNREIHLGQARGFEHVQVQFVLENLQRPGGRIPVKEFVVVVGYGRKRGDARQNGLRPPTVAGIVMDFEAADAYS